METLSEAWEHYEHEILPPNFEEGPRDLVQHAFYHGVIALLMIGHTHRDREASEEERQRMMEGIIHEIHEFNAGCELKMLLHVLGEVLRG
jgi:hypothetical protein